MQKGNAIRAFSALALAASLSLSAHAVPALPAHTAPFTKARTPQTHEAPDGKRCVKKNAGQSRIPASLKTVPA